MSAYSEQTSAASHAHPAPSSHVADASMQASPHASPEEQTAQHSDSGMQSSGSDEPVEKTQASKKKSTGTPVCSRRYHAAGA